jgi:hypothetical protein
VRRKDISRANRRGREKGASYEEERRKKAHSLSEWRTEREE